jgi:predicted dehydrogenase
MLEVGVDGVVIATPGAGQAETAIAALERGVAVFCEGLAGQTSGEISRVIAAARSANLLLGANLPYRILPELRQVRQLCRDGELGEVYSVDVMFHQPALPAQALSGKTFSPGCVRDPGFHILDLALWHLGFPEIRDVAGRLFAQGKLLRGQSHCTEDFAVARFDLENGATIKFACSCSLPAGCGPIIAGSFHGTNGGASFHNTEGSYSDFVARRFRGSKITTLEFVPHARTGGAVADWAERLANGARFDAEVETLATVAAGLDQIYENTSAPLS